MATGFGRKASNVNVTKPKGCKRSHRTLEQKLKKFERNPRGYQFIPAFMHTLNRVLTGKSPETETEERLARAIADLGNDKIPLEEACKKYAALDPDLRSRAFATRYLALPVDRPIADAELAAIVARTPFLTGSPRDRIKAHGKVACCPEDETPPPQMPRDNYSLTYVKLHCIDESDPEIFGSDEPYVTFGVLTEAQAEAGQTGYTVQTPIYEDVDDGETRPEEGEENLQVWGKVAPKPIDSPFLVAGVCMEHDLGSPSEVASGLRSSLTTVATTAAGIGGVAGWIVAGAAAIGVGITFLVDLWAEDDQINGTQTVAFTEFSANSATSSENPRLLDALHFDGGDGDGIYDVFLKLERLSAS